MCGAITRISGLTYIAAHTSSYMQQKLCHNILRPLLSMAIQQPGEGRVGVQGVPLADLMLVCVWQKTLTINVQGLASIPNVTPNPFSASTAPVIFDGTVNEVPGSNVELAISVGNSADPRCETGVQGMHLRTCAHLGVACPLLIGNPISILMYVPDLLRHSI